MVQKWSTRDKRTLDWPPAPPLAGGTLFFARVFVKVVKERSKGVKRMPKWLKIVPKGVKMTQNGQSGVKTGQHGSKWVRNGTVESKWSKTGQPCSKWLKIGPKWLKMAQSRVTLQQKNTAEWKLRPNAPQGHSRWHRFAAFGPPGGQIWATKGA